MLSKGYGLDVKSLAEEPRLPSAAGRQLDGACSP